MKNKLLYFIISITFIFLIIISFLCEITSSKKILTKKKVLFSGDSITLGTHNNNNSWAEYLNKVYLFDEMNNVAVSGATLSKMEDHATLFKQIQKKETNYDYVILQGGINDVKYNSMLGEISKSDDIHSFNEETMIGGLETYFYYATKNYPNAHIGFILIYPTISINDDKKFKQLENTEKYYSLIKKVCSKWNIPVLDLYFDKKYSNIITEDDLDDGIHPNKQGYKKLSKIVGEWMKTLPPYHGTNSIYLKYQG